MRKLSIRKLIWITSVIVIVIPFLFTPFNPSVSISEFQIDPNKAPPRLFVSVTNDGIFPIWLQPPTDPRYEAEDTSYVKYFKNRDCDGEEACWTTAGDADANIRISRGQTAVVRFHLIDGYQSASLHLQFKDWRGHHKNIKHDQFDLSALKTATVFQARGTKGRVPLLACPAVL